MLVTNEVLDSNYKFEDYIDGDLTLMGCDIEDNIQFPHHITGDMKLVYCQLHDGVKLPHRVDGNLKFTFCIVEDSQIEKPIMGGKITVINSSFGFKF
jgi:hypothetical protein